MSRTVLMPTRIEPGPVSISVSAWSRPVFMPAATTNGLMLEPGSKKSLVARLRYRDGRYCSRSFGLNAGWFTIASTSPVATSSTTTEPAARFVLLHGLP